VLSDALLEFRDSFVQFRNKFKGTVILLAMGPRARTCSELQPPTDNILASSPGLYECDDIMSALEFARTRSLKSLYAQADTIY
jgi:hypothetical protein